MIKLRELQIMISRAIMMICKKLKITFWGTITILSLSSVILLNPINMITSIADDDLSNIQQSGLVRGIVRAQKKAAISTKFSERILKIGFKEGESFQKGDVLISFDCRKYERELASASAKQQEMQVELDSSKYLQKHGVGNLQDIEINHARLSRAIAEFDIAIMRHEQCIIKAPFSGNISQINVNADEISETAKPLFVIVSNKNPKIELIVPSKWLSWVKSGAEFQFKIDETDKTYNAKVQRLGAAVDSVSQTVKLFATFQSASPDILPGMSGTAQFKQVVEY